MIFVPVSLISANNFFILGCQAFLCPLGRYGDVRHRGSQISEKTDKTDKTAQRASQLTACSC